MEVTIIGAIIVAKVRMWKYADIFIKLLIETDDSLHRIALNHGIPGARCSRVVNSTTRGEVSVTGIDHHRFSELHEIFS